ncbi:MAG: alpha-L-rhamnosidase N-terminal domain-containing protein [Ignavibacteriales bacterium]|nr:alpha-L-rhamnosidase N-terminal domain-containing protein [Ignavibacteriales bacterium]
MKSRKRTPKNINRRDFFRKTALGGVGLSFLSFTPQSKKEKPVQTAPVSLRIPDNSLPSPRYLNLSPAEWIWYPSGRTLCNTVVLFRRTLSLAAPVKRASGWIVADSRYRLFVNGKRIQWGPAPCDPRWVEADPLDLTASLKEGENVIGAEVLYFGLGDGTWPIGKTGFLFNLEIELQDGSLVKVVSDPSWLTRLAWSWKPGRYKRWYLRSLQEEFDARLYPYGWLQSDFKTDANWLPPMNLRCPADKPSGCSSYPEYAMEIRGTKDVSELRRRSIPMLSEQLVPVKQLSESLWIRWKRTPDEYFDNMTPDCFDAIRASSAAQVAPGTWKVSLDGSRAAALTFEFEEQIVGWPSFVIEAPEGTIVELMVQESHEVGGPALLNTQFYSWTRFICRKGVNEFETFDFESCRWMQLHIRGVAGDVVIRNVGLRRRVFPWLHQPAIVCSEPGLQSLFDASVNTLNNCAQETIVDGMARERQQYSGDGGHQLHAIYYAFGETRQTARYLETFSQGITIDGYFLDCWPAYDRLARLQERQLQMTFWGPLLDHGVGFNFDCWHHYLYTGDLESVREPYPRLLRFFNYLRSIKGSDGLLPVENLGVPSLYIDHSAFKQQKHKQCSFNLYASAMSLHALAPLCDAFGDRRWGEEAREFGTELLKSTVRLFWDKKRNLFVDNLPWSEKENGLRFSDRTLATSVLFDQCPGAKQQPAVEMLAACPPEMGFSYPANAGWRLWALSKGGRADAIVNDLRTRWAPMDSVRLNNTLQEFWTARLDSTDQWSHCAVVPLFVLYMNIAGIRPLTPGYRTYEIVPQCADIRSMDLTAHTVRGPIRVKWDGAVGGRQLIIETPPEGAGEIAIDKREDVALKRLRGMGQFGRVRYQLPAGERVTLNLTHT